MLRQSGQWLHSLEPEAVAALRGYSLPPTMSGPIGVRSPTREQGDNHDAMGGVRGIGGPVDRQVASLAQFMESERSRYDDDPAGPSLLLQRRRGGGPTLYTDPLTAVTPSPALTSTVSPRTNSQTMADKNGIVRSAIRGHRRGSPSGAAMGRKRVFSPLPLQEQELRATGVHAEESGAHKPLPLPVDPVTSIVRSRLDSEVQRLRYAAVQRYADGHQRNNSSASHVPTLDRDARALLDSSALLDEPSTTRCHPKSTHFSTIKESWKRIENTNTAFSDVRSGFAPAVVHAPIPTLSRHYDAVAHPWHLGASTATPAHPHLAVRLEMVIPATDSLRSLRYKSARGEARLHERQRQEELYRLAVSPEFLSKSRRVEEDELYGREALWLDQKAGVVDLVNQAHAEGEEAAGRARFREQRELSTAEIDERIYIQYLHEGEFNELRSLLIVLEAVMRPFWSLCEQERLARKQIEYVEARYRGEVQQEEGTVPFGSERDASREVMLRRHAEVLGDVVSRLGVLTEGQQRVGHPLMSPKRGVHRTPQMPMPPTPSRSSRGGSEDSIVSEADCLDDEENHAESGRPSMYPAMWRAAGVPPTTSPAWNRNPVASSRTQKRGGIQSPFVSPKRHGGDDPIEAYVREYWQKEGWRASDPPVELKDHPHRSPPRQSVRVSWSNTTSHSQQLMTPMRQIQDRFVPQPLVEESFSSPLTTWGRGGRGLADCPHTPQRDNNSAARAPSAPPLLPASARPAQYYHPYPTTLSDHSGSMGARNRLGVHAPQYRSPYKQRHSMSPPTSPQAEGPSPNSRGGQQLPYHQDAQQGSPSQAGAAPPQPTPSTLVDILYRKVSEELRRELKLRESIISSTSSLAGPLWLKRSSDQAEERSGSMDREIPLKHGPDTRSVSSYIVPPYEYEIGGDTPPRRPTPSSDSPSETMSSGQLAVGSVGGSDATIMPHQLMAVAKRGHHIPFNTRATRHMESGDDVVKNASELLQQVNTPPSRSNPLKKLPSAFHRSEARVTRDVTTPRGTVSNRPISPSPRRKLPSVEVPSPPMQTVSDSGSSNAGLTSQANPSNELGQVMHNNTHQNSPQQQPFRPTVAEGPRLRTAERAAAASRGSGGTSPQPTPLPYASLPAPKHHTPLTVTPLLEQRTGSPFVSPRRPQHVEETARTPLQQPHEDEPWSHTSDAGVGPDRNYRGLVPCTPPEAPVTSIVAEEPVSQEPNRMSAAEGESDEPNRMSAAEGESDEPLEFNSESPYTHNDGGLVNTAPRVDRHHEDIQRGPSRHGGSFVSVPSSLLSVGGQSYCDAISTMARQHRKDPKSMQRALEARYGYKGSRHEYAIKQAMTDYDRKMATFAASRTRVEEEKAARHRIRTYPPDVATEGNLPLEFVPSPRAGSKGGHGDFCGDAEGDSTGAAVRRPSLGLNADIPSIRESLVAELTSAEALPIQRVFPSPIRGATSRYDGAAPVTNAQRFLPKTDSVHVSSIADRQHHLEHLPPGWDDFPIGGFAEEPIQLSESRHYPAPPCPASTALRSSATGAPTSLLHSPPRTHHITGRQHGSSSRAVSLEDIAAGVMAYDDDTT